ncbi:MAG TPA: 4Fe-4S dicluster domain-containing protein [Armatimonadetes bacterium]|nr:4Fe-4S dicluster domain-containing protein [Armatimonadota bacterium]
MCQFCVQHGEGKKWYLQAKNYAEDLAQDLRRREYMAYCLQNFERLAKTALRRLEWMASTPPLVRRWLRSLFVRYAQPRHFGQVVPLEDVAQILDLVNAIVRLPCVCRRFLGQREERACFAVSLNPHSVFLQEVVSADYWKGPDTTGLERVDQETALELMRDFERRGWVHTVWTFGTPFIGGLCNCELPYCFALRTVALGAPIFFPAEYVIHWEAARCRGCGACERVCPFGALHLDAVQQQIKVDYSRCYGCGLCRAVCEPQALRLTPRHSQSAF